MKQEIFIISLKCKRSFLSSIKFIDNYLINYRYFLEKDLENFQEQCDRIQNEYNELVSKLEETSKENQQIVEESTIMKK